MSYKNRLQEWCQSNKVEFPVYTSVSFGEPHQLQWKASILINNKTYNSSFSYPSKILAEQDVAQLTLISIASNQLNPPNLFISSESKTSDLYIAFIDLENVNYSIKTKPINLTIYCYISSFSSVLTNVWEPLATIIKVDSAITDAADHLMSYHVGKLLHTLDKSTKLIIASRDKTSAVLHQMLIADGYDTVHVKSAKELESLIAQL